MAKRSRKQRQFWSWISTEVRLGVRHVQIQANWTKNGRSWSLWGGCGSHCYASKTRVTFQRLRLAHAVRTRKYVVMSVGQFGPEENACENKTIPSTIRWPFPWEALSNLLLQLTSHRDWCSCDGSVFPFSTQSGWWYFQKHQRKIPRVRLSSIWAVRRPPGNRNPFLAPLIGSELVSFSQQIHGRFSFSNSICGIYFSFRHFKRRQCKLKNTDRLNLQCATQRLWQKRNCHHHMAPCFSKIFVTFHLNH